MRNGHVLLKKETSEEQSFGIVSPWPSLTSEVQTQSAAGAGALTETRQEVMKARKRSFPRT